MAIRNTLLAGTAADWSDGQVLYAEDLNDTFDASYNKTQSLDDSTVVSRWAQASFKPEMAGSNGPTYVFFSENNFGVIGSTQYIGTTDGGVSFATPASLNAGSAPFIVGVASSTHAIVCQTGTGGSVGYTTNGGVSWTAGTAIPTATTTHSISYPSTSLAVVGIVRSGGSRNIYYSTNQGSSWTQCTSGPTVTVVMVSMFNNSTGFAVTSTGSIWKTTDGAVNWTDTGHTTTSSAGSVGEYSMAAISTSSFVYVRRAGNFFYYDGSGSGVQIGAIRNSPADNTTGVQGGFLRHSNGNLYYVSAGNLIPGVYLFRLNPSLFPTSCIPSVKFFPVRNNTTGGGGINLVERSNGDIIVGLPSVSGEIFIIKP
jgi:photosystem II stability/assembly factor-like uncharacterized protein